ncbi:interferon-induced protein with tetratricopeptide repeats 5-like [Odontesthes bonariensis]|uniref:interferon-induced protein with tetratricopeptide repeats 5-like n=1 Tax=Odontesthes bonariensis TaxID=219752 RepID=UPI003F58753F
MYVELSLSEWAINVFKVDPIKAQSETVQDIFFLSCVQQVLECRYNTSVRKFCVKKLKNIAERRLNRNPRDAAAYGLLEAVAREEGSIRRAVAYYEKALEEDGDNDEYLSAIFELRLELK